MRMLLSAAALTMCFASVAAAQNLTEHERRGIAGAVLAQDPAGNKPISHGFTQGSGGITPRQAAGLAGPGYYVVHKRHMKKKYR